ncbi:MAG: hypothetical protein GX941_00850 [Candidatus Methanofastidiosa archaeon]|jgi:hypothetical protein|nr:hypothetical protein [Candidatus Methanofastidiosa archaeon]
MIKNIDELSKKAGIYAILSIGTNFHKDKDAIYQGIEFIWMKIFKTLKNI